MGIDNIQQKFEKGNRVTLSEAALLKGKYRSLTRWGIEICGEVVGVTEKSDTMRVRVDGEDRVAIWHKSYWVICEDTQSNTEV